MVTTDPDTGPIFRSDLVKGYEVDKGRYVLPARTKIVYQRVPKRAERPVQSCSLLRLASRGCRARAVFVARAASRTA